MAERFFDILFSVSIQHDLLQQGYQDSFRIAPAPVSQQTLSRYGLIFKPWVENQAARPLYRETEGCRILVEKTVDNGVETPLKKFSGLTGLVFEVFLNRPDLLNQVEPFTRLASGTRVPQTLNVPFGKRIWYFDNMEMNGTIDSVPELSSGAVVSSSDMWILIPERFKVPINGNVNKLTVQSLSDSRQPAKEYIIKPRQTAVGVTLSPDIYRFSWSGGGVNPSFVLVNNELYMSNLFGVIQVFKDQNTDYTQPIDYVIPFKS